MHIKPRVNGFGNITEDELKYIQSNLLSLLLEFDSICKKHDITYYLDGGSVLGALRHEGFIPWDDDIDLLMKRSDFNKLLHIIDDELDMRENRVFSYMKRKTNHHRSFARYVNTAIPHILRSTVTEATYPPGVFIDIFVLDPVPASKLNNHTKKLESSEEWFHKRLNGVVGRMPYWKYQFINGVEKVVGENKVFDYFNNQLSRYQNEEADYYVPRNGFNYAVYDGDVFQEPKLVNFAGHKLPAPTMPEKFVRTHYSIDWYLLPPVKKRYSEHLTLTSNQFSVQDFMNQFDWLPDVEKIHKVQQKRHKYQILRRKPYLKTQTYLATLRSIAASIELEEYFKSINKEINSAHVKQDYKKLESLFEPFYDKLLNDNYREYGISIDIDINTLILSAVALVNVGRFYDAERILSVYDTSDVRFNDITRQIETARKKEIAEQDDPKKSKPILHGVNGVPEDHVKDQPNEILNIQIQLLDEIDAICDKHGINYTLTDNLLLDAVVNGEISNDYTDTTIGMTPDNYRKFLSAMKKPPKDRVLQNIFTNRLYRDTSSRYTATDTTLYNINESWNNCHGIYVKIKLLTDPSLKIRRYSRHSIKSAINSNPKKIRVYITSGRKQLRPIIDGKNIKKYKYIQLGSKSYQVFSNIDTLILKWSPWVKGIILRNNMQFTSSIVNTKVPYQEVLNDIKKGLLLKYYYNKIVESYYLKKITKNDLSDYSHRRYLFVVAYNFYRYKLYRHYKPHIEKMNKMLRDKKYEDLEFFLKDYIENFNYFFQYSRVLVFDAEVFDIYLKLLKSQDKEDLADYISKRAKQEDYRFKEEIS